MKFEESDQPPLWGTYLFFAFIFAAWVILSGVATVIIIWAADAFWFNAELYKGLSVREQRAVTRKLFERIDWFYFPIVFVLIFAGLGISEYIKSHLKNKK